MSPYRRRSFHRTSRRPRRRVIWAEYDAVVNMTANNQWFTADLLQTFKAATGADVAKGTVIRTHGYVVPQAVATGDRYWVALAKYNLDDITGATTTSAFVPNPHDNPYIDWAFMTRISIDAFGWSHPSGVNFPGGGSGFDLDLKSRRKLENVQETWGLCLYQDTVGTVAKTYHVFMRTLLALA